MVSEACYTGRPVYVAKLEGRSRRFDALHQSLQEAGYTRPFDCTLETWEYAPLDENQRIAAIVRERMAHR